MAQLPPARREPGLRLRPAESIPLTKVRDGAEALLTMEVSDDLMPIGLHAGEKPELPADSDELVAYYEKQLAATQLVQHRLQKQFDQLTEEKVALETSLSVQTAALQQQLVLAREKAERAMAQAEQAQEKVQSAHAAVGEIVGAVTQLAELLDVAGASNELTHSFEAVAHSTQRTFQAVTAAQEGAQAVLVMQLEARDACQVSPLLTAVSLGEPRTTDAMKRLEEESIRLRTELEEANNREQELEAEMHAAQLLFTGLEAEVVSLQHDQAQAAAKLQVSQEELVAARDQLLEVRDVLSAVGSPEANVLNQGLVKLDAHLSTIRSFIDGLSMPQPAAVVNVSGSNTLQEIPSTGSLDGDADAGIEKLKDLITGLQQQLKGKDAELRAARYASLVVRHRNDARSGAQPFGGSLETSPTLSPSEQRLRGGDRGTRMHMPAFSYLLAARSQALQSPEAAMGGLSTVQVALIAAEREVLSLRSQLSHRQQHIKLLEQRLLEQSQDIAAMCNRGDALAASPVGSRKASFVERKFGLGTEVLMPQKAWDFDGLDISDTSGNLAEQLRPQELTSRTSGDGGNRSGPQVQLPLTDDDTSSERSRPMSERRRRSSGLQVEAQDLHMAPNAVLERDRTIHLLRAQINEFRAVLAAAAGGGPEPGQSRLAVPQALNTPDYNPRITLEDLPEELPEGVRCPDGSIGGGAYEGVAAGPVDAPRPFRLSSGGPLPFQLAAKADGARSILGGSLESVATASAVSASVTLASKGADSSSAVLHARQPSPSSSTRRLDEVKRQLDEATHMLESTQAKLHSTASELTGLQILLDALSKANPDDLAPPGVLSPVGGGDLDGGLLPATRQLSFNEVRARLSAGSGLSFSTNQLIALRGQLQDVIKVLQNSQDHILSMHAAAGAKEASVAHLTEQLQAERAVAAAPTPEGTGFLMPPKPATAHAPEPDPDQQSVSNERSVSVGMRARSPSAGMELSMGPPLQPPVSTPSRRPAINANADTYTPSLVMNPMFHRDVARSEDTPGSDTARMVPLISSSSATMQDGCRSPPRGHAQPDPSATTVHRNLLFDDDALRGPKDSEPWQYHQDPRFSSGTINDLTDPDAQLRSRRNARSAPTDSMQLGGPFGELQAVTNPLAGELSASHQATGGSQGFAPGPRSSTPIGTPFASPPASRLPTVAGAMSPIERSHGGLWPLDSRGDTPSRLSYAASIVSDVESELSQRVTELEEVIMTERNSFADKLMLLKRTKRELEARVRDLRAELRLKDEQLAQLQDKGGSRGRKPAESMVVELQQTVANLTAEVAAKEAGIRARQDLIDDMEHAQSITTRAVSAEVASYRQQLANADAELESLRAQLAEAERLVAVLQAAQLHAAVLGDDGEEAGAEPQEVTALRERVAAQQAELQAAAQRLEAGAHELAAMALDLDATVQRLAEAQVKASAAEAELAAERNARQQLELQVAEAGDVVTTLRAQVADQAATIEAAEELKARVSALRVDLQVATERLDASTHELSAMALELEASGHRLEEARAVAVTVEAVLEAERRARQHLEQQLAEAHANAPHSASALVGQLASTAVENAPYNVETSDDSNASVDARQPMGDQVPLAAPLLFVSPGAQQTESERPQQERGVEGLAVVQHAALSPAHSGASSLDADVPRSTFTPGDRHHAQGQPQGTMHEASEPQSQSLSAATASMQLHAKVCEDVQSYITERLEESSRTEARLQELLADLTEARERVQALLIITEPTQAEIKEASARRDEALVRVEEILTANQQVKAAAADQVVAAARDEALEPRILRTKDSVGGQLDAQLRAAQAEIEPPQGQFHSQTLQAEDRARALQTDVEQHANSLHAVGAARNDDERQQLASLEAAFEAAQSLNNGLWSQLAAVADAVGLDISSARMRADGANDSGVAAVGAAEAVPPTELPHGEASGGDLVSESQLARSDWASPTASPMRGGGDSGQRARSAGWEGVFAALAGGCVPAPPRPQTQPEAEQKVTRPTTVWSGPLNFKAALLSGAARSAAAALQSVGDVPVSPPGKSSVLQCASSSPVSSSGAASASSTSTGSGDRRRSRDRLSTTESRRSLDFHGVGRQMQPVQQQALDTPTSRLQETASQGPLQQRGLQLLQPEGNMEPCAAAEVSMPLDAGSSNAVGKPGDEALANKVPNVAAAVREYIDNLHTDAASVHAQLQSDLQSARDLLIGAQEQLAALRAAHADTLQKSDASISALQQQLVDAEAGRAAAEARYSDLQADLEEASRTHAVAVTELKAAKAALQEQLAGPESGCEVAEQQLSETRAELNKLQQRAGEMEYSLAAQHEKAIGSGHGAAPVELEESSPSAMAAVVDLVAVEAVLQQQLAETEAGRDVAEQQLAEAREIIQDLQWRIEELEASGAAESGRCALQVECKATRRPASTALEAVTPAMLQQLLAGSEAGRKAVEEQLVQTRTEVQTLQQRMEIARQAASAAEASLAEKREMLEAAESGRSAVQAELEEAKQAHTTAVEDLEAAKAVLQQQFEDAEAGREVLGTRLADARVAMQELQERLQIAEQVIAAEKERAEKLEGSLTDHRQRVEEMGARQCAVQTEMEEVIRAHSADAATFESVKLALQQQLANSEAERDRLEALVAEAQSATQVLQKRVEELQAALSEQILVQAELEVTNRSSSAAVVDLEVARGALQQQLVDAEAGRKTAEQQLAEARTACHDLQERVEGLEALLSEEHGKLEAAESGRSAVQAELEEAGRAHSAAVGEYEAAKSGLQTQLAAAKASQEAAAEQLDEARAQVQDLQQRLQATEQAASAGEQRAEELKAALLEEHAKRETAEASCDAVQAELEKIRTANLVEITALQQQLTEVEASRVVADKHLANGQATIQELQQRVEDLDASLSELHKKLEASEADRNALQAQLEVSSRSASAAVVDFEIAQATLQKQLEDAEAGRETAEEQLEEVRAANRELQERITITEQAIATEREQVQQLKSLLSEQGEKLQAVEAGCSALQAEVKAVNIAHSAAVDEHEAAVAAVVQQLADAQAESRGAVLKLQKRAEDLESSLVQQHEKLQEAEAGRSTAEAKYVEESCARTAAVVELDAMSAAMQQLLAEMQAARDTSENQLAQAGVTIQELQQRAEAGEQAFSAERQRAEELFFILAGLREKLEAAEASCSAMQAERGDEERARSFIVADLEAAKAACVSLTDQLEASATRVSQLEQEGNTAEAALAVLKKDLDQSKEEAAADKAESERLRMELQTVLEGMRRLQEQSDLHSDRAATLADRLRSAETALSEKRALMEESRQLDAERRAASERQMLDVQAQLTVKEDELRTVLSKVAALNAQLAAVGALVADHAPTTRTSATTISVRALSDEHATSLEPEESLAASVAWMRASLTRRAEAAEQEAASLADRATGLSNSLEEARALVAKLEGLLAMSNAELLSATERLQDLERRLQEKEALLHEHETGREAIAQELAALQQRVVILQEDVDDARDNANNVSAQLDDYKAMSGQQCMEAERARDEAIMAAETVRSECDALRAALLAANAETEEHRAQLAAVEVKLSEVEAQVDTLQRGVGTSEAQADELRAELAAVQYDLVLARDERDDAIRQLDATREDAAIKGDEYQQQLDNMRQELAHAALEHGLAARQLADMISEISATREEQKAALDKASSDLDIADKEAAVLHAKLVSTEAELLSVVKELADAREQLLVARSERDTVAAKLAEAQVEAKRDILAAAKDLAEAREQLLAAHSERDAAAAKLVEAESVQHELLATRELAEAREQLVAAQAERDAARAKLAEVHSELASTMQSLVSARDIAEAKRAEHEATLKLLQAAVADKDSACRDLTDVRSELLAAVDMLAGAREQRDSAIQQLEEMRAEIGGLQSQLGDLAKQMLAKELADAEEARLEERDAAAVKLAKLQAQVASTTQLLASAHEAVDFKCAEHEATAQLLRRALADKDALSSQLAGARAEVLAALGELSDARAQRDAAMQQLNAFRDVLAAIEDERSSSAAAAAVTAAVMREQQRTVEAQQRTLDVTRASEAARVAEHLRALGTRADDLTRHAEDLQRRLNAAEAHLSSERAEAQVVRARLELHLASARGELEATAVERTSALQQLADVRVELVDVTGRCASLEDMLSSAEKQAEEAKEQLDDIRQQLLDAESRAAVERLEAETARAKAEELQGKLRADLAAAHAELVALTAQRDALKAQLALVLPTLSAAQAEHAAGVQQLSNLKGDQALLESHLGPLEEHAKLLQQQAEDLRQQLAVAEARHVAEKADTRSVIARLEMQLDAARTELTVAAAARDASVQQLAQLRSEHLEAVGARTTLEAQVRGLQQHVDLLQQQASSLQEHVTGVEARLLAERAEVHSARTQTATVRAELATVMLERDTAVNQVAALRSELALVKSERDTAMQQHSSGVQSKAELENQVRSLEQHITQLQGQLEAVARLREQLAEAATALAAEQARHTAAEEQLATTKADLAAALSNNAGVQQQVGEVHEELATLRRELAVATKELATQQTLTESRVTEMQAKVAQARAQASEAAAQVQQLQSELSEARVARQDAERQLLDRDVDAKGMVTGLEEALEATRAALEAERARGEQKAKELQDQLQAAIGAGASARDHLKHARDDLDAARAAQLAEQAAAEADIASLKEQLKEAQQALQDAQDAARAQEAELRTSVQAAKKAAAASQQRLVFLDAQATAARAAEADAQRALAEAMHGMGKQEAEAASRIAHLEAGLATAREVIERLENQQKVAEDANRDAEGEIVAMGDKLREERERTSLLEPRLEALASEVAALQSELSKARAALSRYEAYAYDAEAEIQELRNAAEVSSEENSRLQKQLDQLVDQLRRQTQQLLAAEEDTAQLRQEVAAMNVFGGGTRRSGSSSRGRSAERRHGSTGRATAVGARPAGGAASILDDSMNAQQLLILRKPQQVSGRQAGPAVASSGPNSALSRSGEPRASGQPAGRVRSGSVEPRPARGAAAAERCGGVYFGGHAGATSRSPPMSPSTALQKRLTDEATQLRWEVVADSSRVRELQEKRAGGVQLSRAEVSEMELLTARLGAHHARISAIMDTVKLARGQQQGGPEPAANLTAAALVDAAQHGHELRDRTVGTQSSPQAAYAGDPYSKRHAYQQVPSPLRDMAPSDLEFPDQPRQQPAFHPHPPMHPPMQHMAFGAAANGGLDDAAADMEHFPAPPTTSGKRLPGNAAKPEGPSRLRFFDLETRAEPAELPRGAANNGTEELLSSVRTALGGRERDDVMRRPGTPKHGRDTGLRPGDISPNQDVDSAHGGGYGGGDYSSGQVQSGSDSVSPGHGYSACASPSGRSVRSTQATINVSPWYPPGATPARGTSPPGRAVSPVNMTARRIMGVADGRGGHFGGGRSAGATPVRGHEPNRDGLFDPHAGITDDAEGVASSVLSAVGGEAVGAGPGGGGGGAPRAAARYRTPYLRMLQDMVLLGQVAGGGRSGGTGGTLRRPPAVAAPAHGAAPAAAASPHPNAGAGARQHQCGNDGEIEMVGHWGSAGGADGSPRASSPRGSVGGSSRSQSPGRPLYLPSGVGPGSPTPS